MTTPEIFALFDTDIGEHVIMVRSHLSTELFGPRIFRAPPHPAVKTRHATAESAEADVAAIREYFTDLPGRKRGARKEAEPVYGNGLGGIEDCPLFFI